jgi:hypothetical protein
LSKKHSLDNNDIERGLQMGFRGRRFVTRVTYKKSIGLHGGTMPFKWPALFVERSQSVIYKFTTSQQFNQVLPVRQISLLNRSHLSKNQMSLENDIFRHLTTGTVMNTNKEDFGCHSARQQ